MPTPTERFFVWGRAELNIADVDEVKLYNIQVGVNFLNGAIIPPGGSLSFDHVARSWDGKEDDAYRIGWGTSCDRGLVPMKGGGVCAVSTALWRATLKAGLETVRRKNHAGRIDTYNPPGLDATNTLIIANDSSATITVRALLDGDILRIELIGDDPPDRVATIRGPFPLGELEYVVYQDIQFSDGSKITYVFHSSYCW
jgi:vancomycin resistance protein YoaR